MIQVDTLILPDVVIDDEFSRVPVRGAADRTLAGGLVVWSEEVSARPLDLVGGPDWGVISRQDLAVLHGLASVPGAIYELDYEGDSRLVRFRHEDEPVISADPLTPRPNAADGDLYRNLRIKLSEV